jgi:hypothetical protein
MGRGDQLSHNQHVSRGSYDAMDANRAVARRRGKHKHAIEWHELVGPDESRDTEHEVQLHDQQKYRFSMSISGKLPFYSSIVLEEAWKYAVEVGLNLPHALKTPPLTCGPMPTWREQLPP